MLDSSDRARFAKVPRPNSPEGGVGALQLATEFVGQVPGLNLLPHQQVAAIETSTTAVFLTKN